MNKTLILRKTLLLCICFLCIDTYAQKKKNKLEIPYLALGVSVVKPLEEFNLEIGQVYNFKNKYTIRPSISLNRTATNGKVYRTAEVIYGAGYRYEVYDHSIDHITRGIASIEMGYSINDKLEITGGYGLGILISTEGIIYAQQGTNPHQFADFYLPSRRRSFEAPLINDYTGIRRGQHFISVGTEYSLKKWLRIGLRSRIGLLDQTNDAIYKDGFSPFSFTNFNIILDF